MVMHLLRHLVDARSDDVIRDDTPQLVEPEEREFRKDAYLAMREAIITLSE
jgi:hypothetical protein